MLSQEGDIYQGHVPVMVDEVISALSPVAGGVYLDGTFGGGGHSKAILDCADNVRVIGIDRDPQAIERSKKLSDRIKVYHGCFGEADKILRSAGIEYVDGVLLDIGVSSFQIDDAGRGFSFRYQGKLDMRMDNLGSGITAADIVNEYSESEIADILYKYGQERHSRRVARAILKHREQEPITETVVLADIIRSAVPRSKDGIDPATRSFQALRIAVNDELGELERGLQASLKILKHGGRLAVITFHSLEDSIVKNFIAQHSGKNSKVSRHLPAFIDEISENHKMLEPINKKPIVPTEKETKENPRARSAKLRAAIRIRQNEVKSDQKG